MGRGIIILVLAVPLGFVFWLLWRRMRLRADGYRSKRRAVASKSLTDKSDATLQTEPAPPIPAELKPPDEKEQESVKDIEVSETEQPVAGPAGSSTESESAESDVSGETVSVEPIADRQTQAGEEVSSENSTAGPLAVCVETSPECNAPTVEKGAIHTSAQDSVVEVMGPGGSGLPAEKGVPEENAVREAADARRSSIW